MRSRNNLVELARFLFSILVVGYHIQMTFLGDSVNFFENGALAVEFFFLNSSAIGTINSILKSIADKYHSGTMSALA